MKKVILVLTVLFFTMGNINAQFEAGKSHAGPSLGIGFSGYGLTFGADYEYGMNLKDIGVEAPGILGVGGILRYYNWSESWYSYKWSYTDIIIGAQGNYHFKVGDGKVDPWIGLVLGFDISSSSYDGPAGSANNYSNPSSGLFFNGNAGVRYWFSPNMAARASLGFGSIVSSIILGVDFKF